MKKNRPLQVWLLTLMRISLFQIFLAIIFAGTTQAYEGRSQNLLAVKVNIHAQEQRISKVLKQIERQADVKFVFSSAIIQASRVVSADLSDQSLDSALGLILNPLGLTYELSGKTIVVKRNSHSVETSETAPVAFSVKGRITGDQNDALPGVSVAVKGTTIGTTTDANGNYSLTVPDENGTLVFSFIGYVTEEVAIGGRTTIDISLVPDLKSLQEVVVVGYGEQKKETVTGAVATVKGTDLVKSPAVNLSNSLAGRLPGVTAVQASGEPGYDGSSIRIRGSNTLGNNDALVVIDGVPARAGGFDRINPADIESISVLKDASAAIYGARAANGVILIKTKRGKTGKPQLSYSYNQGWSQPTVVPKLANSSQFAEMRNELEVFNLNTSEWGAATTAFRETGSYKKNNGDVVNAPFKPEDFQKFADGSDPWFHPNTDWFGDALKNWSPQSKHNVQLTGGTDNFHYLASLGYQNQDAYYKNSATGYKQYDIRMNMDGNINKYIHVNLGLLGREEYRFYPTRGAGSIFRMLMRGLPTMPAFWPNGLPGPDIENGENPVVITTNQTGYDRDKRDYFQTNGNIEFTIPWVQGLKLTANAAVDKYIRRNKTWATPWYLYSWQQEYEADGVTPKLVKGKRGPAEPNLNQGDENQLNILLGALLTYERTIGKHHVSVLAGSNRETIQNDNFNAYRRYFISPAIDQMFAGGDAEKNNGGGAWERARLNYFGRVAYNFQEKYLAEFLWRYDGSYMFPQNTRYGFFPGIMAGWQVSEESFFKDNISFINYLKIRGSWGQMGNDNITLGPGGGLLEYQYLSTYGFSSYIIDNKQVKTLFETRVPNKNITWEIANNSNLGLEGQLLQGKLGFEFDVFLNRRTNIIWPRFGSVPQTTGMSLPAENIGKVENRGWEFKLTYTGNAGDFKYNVGVNGGYAKNKILFWDEAPGAPAWQRTTGKPMYTYLTYQYDGVFKDQAAIDANTLDYTAITNTLRPGDMKYKDYNKDGKITPDDQVRNDRTSIPLFTGGATIGLSYRSFDCSILLQGALGGQVYVSTGESGSIGNYLTDVYENRWTVDNPSDKHPRIADRSNQYYSNGNTYWLRSNDYIRLKNFELGYTLPATLSQKAGISTLRFYVNGLNLLTLDKLKVFDPESTNSVGQYYPQSRIINTGLTVTF